jgi:hypothetical protein
MEPETEVLKKYGQVFVTAWTGAKRSKAKRDLDLMSDKLMTNDAIAYSFADQGDVSKEVSDLNLWDFVAFQTS